MNLINQEISEFPIHNFRQTQYDNVLPVLESCFNHIGKNCWGFELRPDFNHKEHILVTNVDYQYHDIKCSSSSHITCMPFADDTPTLVFLMPNLLMGNYFHISSRYIIPSIYIVDKPVIYTHSCISISSLLCKVAIYSHKGKIHLNFHHNIYPFNEFMELLLYNYTGQIKKIAKLIGVDDHDPSICETKKAEMYEAFATNLSQTDKDPDKVRKFLNSVFFDDRTIQKFVDLYKIDAENVTLEYIINEIILKDISDEEKEDRCCFINLDNKHLQFAEPLLWSIIQNISMSYRSALRGKPLFRIDGAERVINHFFSELKGKTAYKSVNGLNSSECGASFVIYHNTDTPSAVNLIHNSFKHRICPVSVGGSNIGETICLTSDIDIDIRTGEFL